MTAKPLISVIMPLFNKRPYVTRAIRSIRQQTFREWELIIVDDGSTDGSVFQIPSDDPRIKVLQQENKGPGAARNKGIMMASAEVISFLDADDFYYPSKLESEYALLQKHNAEWVISPFEYEAEDQIGARYVRDSKGDKLKTEPRVFDNAYTELQLQGIHIDGLCIRKSLLNELKGFNEQMRCYEITEFITRCALKQPRIVVNCQPLYRVADVPNSAFKKTSHLIDGMRQMGERLYSLANEYPEYFYLLTIKSRQSLLSHSTALILANRKGEARKYLTEGFPYPRDGKWWKMWIGSWVPVWLLRGLYK